MKKRTKSSYRWLARQRRDPFANRATSRAYFKLEALDKRFRLTNRSRIALELGAAPGGWTEYLAPRCRRVVACDLVSMKAMEGVEFIQGDIRQPCVEDKIFANLDSQLIDLVLSDMAPHISGNKVRDQAQSLELIDCALRIGSRCLRPEGRLVVKMFQGAGFEATLDDMRSRFAKVVLARSRKSLVI